MPGVFEPPPDVEKEDPTLAPGTIAVELRDPDDRPVSNESVTLGILINSIAKGDSRKHLQGTTDARGAVVFSGLETISNIAYRVSSGYRGGSFAASPFQLGQAKSMRVVLHVYPVTRDLGSALIVCEAAVAAELKDDRIQIEEALTIYNLGRTAWQPDDVRMALPEGYTAFTAQATMIDQGVDEVGGFGKLRGTFPPGRHPIEFRFKIPWSGDKDVDFEAGLPPHVAIARVMMPATASVKLTAADFPPAEVRHDEQGQSFLVTERKLRPDDARLTTLLDRHSRPSDRGSWRASGSRRFLAAFGIGSGLFLASVERKRPGKPRERDVMRARSALLEELLGLERARTRRGRWGPAPTNGLAASFSKRSLARSSEAARARSNATRPPVADRQCPERPPFRIRSERGSTRTPPGWGQGAGKAGNAPREEPRDSSRPLDCPRSYAAAPLRYPQRDRFLRKRFA